MKNVVLASVLMVIASLTIFSCNNGAYDAHPNTDLSSALNPESPDSGGVSVYLGSLEGRVNSRKQVFTPAFYYIDEGGTYRFVARIKDDTLFHRTLRFSIANYNGVDTYSANADSQNPIMTFSMFDSMKRDLQGRRIVKTYTVNTSAGKGFTDILIDGEDGGNIRGRMYGTMYLVSPTQNLQDSVSFELSQFYFKKENYPLEGGLQE